MVIADETDAAAQAKWESYKAGKDLTREWMGARRWRRQGGSRRNGGEHSQPGLGGELQYGYRRGFYATVAKMLDELATVEGVAGVMLTFDDFIFGIEAFGGAYSTGRMTCRKCALTAR